MWRSKIEGSQATAKQTAEVLRSVISQQRVPHTNQAGALIDAVRAVGEQLIAANPVGMRKYSSFSKKKNACSFCICAAVHMPH